MYKKEHSLDQESATITIKRAIFDPKNNKIKNLWGVENIFEHYNEGNLVAYYI